METLSPSAPAAAPSAAPSLSAEALRGLLGAAMPSLLVRRGEGLAVKDAASGRYVHANEAWAAWLGRRADQVPGRTDADFFDPETAAAMRAADQSALAQADALASEHRLERDGGKREFAVLRVASAADSSGRRWIASVWTDLQPERQREAQLKQALAQIEQQQHAHDALRRELADQALRDPASGLYSRVHFEDQLRREVDLSNREHREFAIAFAELDEPDDDRRAAGPAGEQAILATMGRLLKSGTRAMDASCRLDDRRFAVLLSGVGLATAHSRMEHLRRRCATEIVVHDGRELGFTVAMGVASFPHTAQTQGELIAACESALGEARRRGGNVVTLAAIRLESA